MYQCTRTQKETRISSNDLFREQFVTDKIGRVALYWLCKFQYTYVMHHHQILLLTLSESINWYFLMLVANFEVDPPALSYDFFHKGKNESLKLCFRYCSFRVITLKGGNHYGSTELIALMCFEISTRLWLNWSYTFSALLFFLLGV